MTLPPFRGDCSAEADLPSLGAKKAHLGGEIAEAFCLRTSEYSWVLDEDEDDDTVLLGDMTLLSPFGDKVLLLGSWAYIEPAGD